MIRCAGVIWDTGQFSVQKLSSSSSMVLWMPSDVLSPHPPLFACAHAQTVRSAADPH